jgi:universal stress protein E
VKVLFPAIRSVLVATDLSPESDQVVREAATLAEHVGAQLHSVHAANILGRAASGLPLDVIRLEGLVGDARDALRSQIDRVLPRGMEMTSASVDYKGAAPAILEKAREVDADLIVMGPHSAWVPASDRVGTTAQRVVEKATVPCMVVKRPLVMPPRRVLLPVGESDIRVGALGPVTRWLCGLHPSGGPVAVIGPTTELWALHVIESPLRWREISESFAEAIRDIGPDSPVQSRRRLAWSRDPASEIVHRAEQGAVDLVVLGVRGHGALVRFLVGSVSSAVLRRTDRSVLLFPPRLYERWAQARETYEEDSIQDLARDWNGARMPVPPPTLT